MIARNGDRQTTPILLLTRPPRLTLPPALRPLAVARERSRLGQLSDDVLRDIGVTPDEARREAARPFWDLPER